MFLLNHFRNSTSYWSLPSKFFNGPLSWTPCNLPTHGDSGGTVVEVLRYKSEGRWFDPRRCHGIFHWYKSFWTHYGPGVDSASNRNEYQVYFLWVNAASALGWQPYHHPVPLSRNLGTLTSWNTLGHPRPVTGLPYLYLTPTHTHRTYETICTATAPK
jgi:hypothetical protein